MTIFLFISFHCFLLIFFQFFSLFPFILLFLFLFHFNSIYKHFCITLFYFTLLHFIPFHVFYFSLFCFILFYYILIWASSLSVISRNIGCSMTRTLKVFHIRKSNWSIEASSSISTAFFLMIKYYVIRCYKRQVDPAFSLI